MMLNNIQERLIVLDNAKKCLIMHKNAELDIIIPKVQLLGRSRGAPGSSMDALGTP